MFTDRFIRLPIKVFDRKTHELTGDSESYDSIMCMNPFHIVHYRPSSDIDDETDTEIVSVSDTNGEVILVYMSVIEFEKLLNNFGEK